MTRILFVHGRSQEEKSSEQLRQEWMPVLERGLAETNLTLPDNTVFDFPFFGKQLFDRAEARDAPLAAEIKLKGGSVNENYLHFRSDMFEQIRIRAGISVEQVEEEYRRNGEPIEKGAQNWEWVQRILQALDKHAPHLRESVLDQFVRDVYIYLTDPAVRMETNEIVEGELTDEKTIVVGHSLGSVVAYDVLVKTSKSTEVPLFLTLGSPLAIEGIKTKLLPPIQHPTQVHRWFNAYDERDVVALHPLDVNHFDVTPSIINKNNVDNHTENRHGIAGYLDDSDVIASLVAAV